MIGGNKHSQTAIPAHMRKCICLQCLLSLVFVSRTRQPGVKFIIILDRRLDTWGSIKTALGRIAVSNFPSAELNSSHFITMSINYGHNACREKHAIIIIIIILIIIIKRQCCFSRLVHGAAQMMSKQSLATAFLPTPPHPTPPCSLR